MPRAKTDKYWIDRVRVLVENGQRMTIKKIAEALEEEGGVAAPSERTVRRLREEYLELPESERLKYRYFYWPESIEMGVLPWTASPAALELLRLFDEWKPIIMPRPTIRLAVWFWRVSEAGCGMNAASRLQMALQLASWSEERDAGLWREIEQALITGSPYRGKPNLKSIEGRLALMFWLHRGGIPTLVAPKREEQ